MIRRPPRSTLFPYTRSSDLGRGEESIERSALQRPLVTEAREEPVQHARHQVERGGDLPGLGGGERLDLQDRKSTRLNSSHGYTSYAVFCLKKKTATVPPVES